MADLFNLDAELEEGMMDTDDNDHHIGNNENTNDVAISTDELDDNRNDAVDNDDANVETSDYPSMSNVPIALREAAIERQRNRRGEGNYTDNDEDYTVDADMRKPTKEHLLWDMSAQEHEEKQNCQVQLQNLPYTRLYDTWVQECHAPELLPYPYETIAQIRDGMLRYENYMEERDNSGYSSSNNNHGGNHNHRHNQTAATSNENLNALMDSLLRIDVERVKFLLSDLLKRRIQKITTYPQHYMNLSNTVTNEDDDDDDDDDDDNDNNKQDHPLMCGAEITLVQNYMKLMKQHLSTTVTDHFPQNVWRSIDIPNKSRHEPNIHNQYVFIRCKESVTIPESSATTTNSDLENDDTILSQGGGQFQQAGMCLIVRYERIRQLLLQGKVELM